ncbi:MAG: cell division protein FtsQ/DivIB [Candidatus Omnitrophica bacterium]|nr:cell division protein FtsQ/DivIB [Candidatus Omnitrophota bacterium]
MVKRKQKPISLSAVKWPAILIITLVLLVWGVIFICQSIKQCLVQSDYFKVKVITIDPSLQSITKRDLRNVLGKSIVFVNLQEVESDLLKKYPAVSALQVEKHFPNQISIKAKRRFPLVQVRTGRGSFLLDNSGVVMGIAPVPNKGLPVLLGWDFNGRLVLGKAVNTAKTQLALRIAGAFTLHKSLASYKMDSISVENPARICLNLTNGLQVIVDEDKLEEKIELLGLMLSQGNLNLNRIKYIDLRFKEPVLGTK